MDITKTLVLTTTGVGVSLAATIAINHIIERAKPNFFKLEDVPEEEKIRNVVRILGTSLAVSVVASLIAGAAQTILEDAVWPEEQDEEPIL
jgi:ABC-type lipoprotein release transport system permease subunit